VQGTSEIWDVTDLLNTRVTVYSEDIKYASDSEIVEK